MRRGTYESVKEWLWALAFFGVIAFAVFGCGTLQPDRFEVSPYYGNSVTVADRPLFDGIESPSYGLMLSWGWDLTEDDAALEIRKLRASWESQRDTEHSKQDHALLHNGETTPDPGSDPLGLLDKILATTTKYGVDATLVLLLFAAAAYLWFAKKKRINGKDDENDNA